MVVHIAPEHKGPFINYGLGGVGKLEGGNQTFWGIRMGGNRYF